MKPDIAKLKANAKELKVLVEALRHVGDSGPAAAKIGRHMESLADETLRVLGLSENEITKNIARLQEETTALLAEIKKLTDPSNKGRGKK